MTFQGNKPEQDDILADSQPDLLNNYSVQDTVFSVDHVGFTQDENAGKHNKATIRFDDAVTVPNPDDDEITIYPVENDNGRKKLNAIVNDDDGPQSAGFIPFALANVNPGAAATAVNFRGNSVNFDTGATFRSTTAITMVFDTPADDENYQVFVTQGATTFSSATNIGTVRVMNRQADRFQIVVGTNALASVQRFCVIVFKD